MPVDYLNDPLTIQNPTTSAASASPQAQSKLSDDAAAQIARANMQQNMQQSQQHIGDVQGLLNQPELDTNHQFIQQRAQIHQNIVNAGPSLEETNKNYYKAFDNHMQAVSKLNEVMQKNHPGQAASAFALSFLGLGSPYVQLMRMKNLGPAAMQEKSTKQTLDNYANLLGSLNKEETTALEDTMKSSADTHQILATKAQIEGQIGTAINQASEIAGRVLGIPQQNQAMATSAANEALAKQKLIESKAAVAAGKPGMDIEKEKVQIAGENIRNKNEASAETSKQQAQNRSSHLGFLQDETKNTRAEWKDAQKAQALAEKKLADEEALAKDNPKDYPATEVETFRKAAKDAATAANRAHAEWQEAHQKYNDFAAPLVGHSNAAQSPAGESAKQGAQQQYTQKQLLQLRDTNPDEYNRIIKEAQQRAGK
jgi:hypothetical protein